jgi:hypothetical protein
VAKVIGQEIELTPAVKKMVKFFPEPKPLTRHALKAVMLKFQ